MTEFPRHEIEWEAQDHASPEMLAALVDGTLDLRVRKGVEKHLRHCRRCFATYGELARLQTAAGTGFVVESFRRGRCRDANGRRPPTVAREALVDATAWLTKNTGRSSVESSGRVVIGDPVNGKRIYQKVCAGCHGAEGEGKEGPALGNAAFLSAANDGFLQATILRGRLGTAMPEFNRDQAKYPRLSAGEVDDIVSFIRSLMNGEKEEN